MTNNLQNDTVMMMELKNNFRQYSMFIILILIGITFSLLTDGVFFSSRNIYNLFLQASALSIAAMGVSMVLIAGHLDLSIGSVVGLTGAVSATLMANMGWGTVPTIAVVLCMGVLIGCWQGFWIAYRAVPSFIVTLAGMLVFRGIVIGITGGRTITPLNPEFRLIGQGFLPRIFTSDLGFNDTAIILGMLASIVYIILEISKYKSRKKYDLELPPLKFIIIKMFAVSLVIMVVMVMLSVYLGVSYALIIVLLLAVGFSFMASNTKFGRYIYAIGGQKEAAELSGINIKKTTFILFVIMGVMSSVSGIIYTARINAGVAGAGQYMELDAIGAAIIGGTSTLGGKGTIFGAIIGALIMTSIDNGMSLMNLASTYQFIVKGLVLLLAVWLDVATKTQY